MLQKKSAALRILVVDDEALIRWAVCESLTAAGHQVVEAGSASEALGQLASPSPDVIVLDYRLPDSDDLGLLDAIRRALPATPVIMMSAHGTRDVQEAALQRGAYCLIGKPFELRDLHTLIQQATAAPGR